MADPDARNPITMMPISSPSSPLHDKHPPFTESPHWNHHQLHRPLSQGLVEPIARSDPLGERSDGRGHFHTLPPSSMGVGGGHPPPFQQPCAEDLSSGPPAEPHYDSLFFSTPFQAAKSPPAVTSPLPDAIQRTTSPSELPTKGSSQGRTGESGTSSDFSVTLEDCEQERQRPLDSSGPSRAGTAPSASATRIGSVLDQMVLHGGRTGNSQEKHKGISEKAGPSPHPPPISTEVRSAFGPPAPPSAPAVSSNSGNRLLHGPRGPPTRAMSLGSAALHSNSLDAYALDAVVGIGSFSKVRLAVHRRTRMRVAVKLVELRSEHVRAIAENEATVFQTLRRDHRNVLGCIEIVRDALPGCMAFVLEYCAGGELFDLLACRHAEVTMADAQGIVFQVMDALAFMHSKDVVHRDLKLENILLVSRQAPFQVKLSDFGFSRVLSAPDERLTTRCGSEEYSAPEVIMGSEHDPRAADVWSAGVVLYAVLVGHLPFAVESRDVVVEENMQVPVDQHQFGGGGGSSSSSGGHSRKAAPGLIRHLEDKLNLVSNKTMAAKAAHELGDATDGGTSRRASVGSTLCNDQNAGSVLASPSAVPQPVRVVRRRSTRKAGRKALWHRIARAEFSFPDEAVEVVAGNPQMTHEEVMHAPGVYSADCASMASRYPLLTPETKALVRAILEPGAARRPTTTDLLRHPWIAAGAPSATLP